MVPDRYRVARVAKICEADRRQPRRSTVHRVPGLASPAGGRSHAGQQWPLFRRQRDREAVRATARV